MAGLRRPLRLLPLALLLTGAWSAGAQDSSAPQEDFRVYTEHPRLFLRPQRLRLLRRERERQSMRWEQVESLVRGGATLAEPGLALALYFAVTGDKAAAQKAVDWAMTSTDLHQLALIFDWCQDTMNDARRQQLAARIGRLNRRPGRDDTASVRDRVLAAIAIADEDRDGSERTLTDVVQNWWRKSTAPRLARGDLTIAHEQLYPLEEILHAVRDNLKIELRSDAGDYFTHLPAYELSSYYPAVFDIAGNDYLIPAFAGRGEPDAKRAAMSRASELALVAYDTNARETQYVQGWLMQDRFLLRDTLGAPYEFIWGNPYQPGLSYMQLPLTYYDPLSGALFVRSSWEDDASWFGIVGPEMQLFEKGRVTVLQGTSSRAERARPVELGSTEVVLGRSTLRFRSSGDTAYLVGLAPLRPCLLEIDDEELQEAETDRAGNLELHFPKDRQLEVLIHERQ